MEPLYSEIEKQRPTTLPFRVWGPRLLVLADLRFVDGLIQMLDRLYAVSVEIMLCGFELMLGIAHRFKSFVDVGMRFRRSCAGWHGRKSCYGWNRRDRRLWSGRRRGECQGKEKCCHDEQSQQPDLFQVFLLVRIPARTQPV
jgi:hypothetical protein